MTTPERLRRRQIRESIGIAVLAVALVVAVLYFRAQDASQRECVTRYIASNAQTSKLRGELVERESQANREVIASALSAQSRDALVAAREKYLRTLSKIDRARDENPVQPFPAGVCD